MRRDILIFTLFCHLMMIAFVFATSSRPQIKIAQKKIEKDELNNSSEISLKNERSSVNQGLVSSLNFENQEIFSKTNDLPSPSTEKKNDMKEVIVKKGDSLDKIAKSYGVSTRELMAWNHLFSDRISCGQVLHLFSKQLEEKQKEEKVIQEEEFYEIKKGDNLWKIAQERAVSYKQLVRLNNLSEEKARNLQIGDRIRLR